MTKKYSPKIHQKKKYIYKIYKNYSTKDNYYNIKKINEIIADETSYIIAEFKDFLIKEDYSDFYKENMFYQKVKNVFQKYLNIIIIV